MNISKSNYTQYYLAALFVLAALCIASYWNSLDVPFHFDDETNITGVEAIQISDLNIETVLDAGLKGRMPSRPLANISFALNYWFTGLNVTYFHIVNVLIHFINGLLVYLLSLSLFRQLRINNTGSDLSSSYVVLVFAALFSACLFLVHPIQTQSVTYIVQRMNSLAVLFYLLSIYLYILARDKGSTNRRWVLYTTCLLSWCFSLASKEIAVTLPLIIFLYEWFFYQNLDTDWLKKKLPAIAFLLVAMFCVVLVFTGLDPLSRILGDYQGRDFSLLERLMTQPRVIVLYLGLILLPLPSRLNLLHDISTSYSFLDPVSTLVSLIFLVTLFVFAMVYAKKYRLVSFCIFWFFIHLLVESSVIALEMVYEHRLYLPMVGVSIGMGYLLMNLFHRYKTLVSGAGIAMLVVLTLGTHIRNETWASAESLWRDVISKNPISYRGHYNLASELLAQDRLVAAENYFHEAIRLKPDYARAHNNLGNTLKQKGELEQAIEHYNIALGLDPQEYHFLYYYNLGHAHTLDRDYPAALAAYTQSILLENSFAPVHFNIAELYELDGQYEKAREHFAKAVEHDPSLADAWDRIGIVYSKEQDLDNAIVYFKKALQTNPQYLSAHINLTKVYLYMNDIDNACKQFSLFSDAVPVSEPMVPRLRRTCNNR